MGSGRHRRTAWATGLSLVLHVAALTGMVIGLKITSPPPEDRAIEVQLMAPPKLQPRPEPAHRASQPASAAPSLRPHLTPQPPADAPVAAVPVTPAPALPAQADAGPKGLLPSLSGRLGCDDPIAFHLTPAQRQVCANNLAALAKAAKPLDLDISDEKKAAYDRNVHCREVYTGRKGVPPSNSNFDGPVQGGGVHSNQNPGFGANAGMGYVPSFKECPAADR